MNRRYLLVPLVCGMAACADQALTTGPTVSGPNFDIADAERGYKAGFYWLPPMVADPVSAGTFDAELSPTVEICALVDNACGTVIATYTTTEGPGGEIVRLSVDDEHYHVNWHTDEFDLSATGLYRVSVRAGIHDVLLGFADVQPVDNGSGLKKIDTDEYIGLVDGRTLPIKLRIETGIVGLVEVQPVGATADPGATQQFMATLRDLHGELMSDDVSWASSDEAVATVDQTGLATAVADGVATITATSERILGSAILTVEAGGIVVMSVGRGHTCALAPDGRAFCWGSNNLGQLGNGTTTDRVIPTPVSGGLTFVALALGDFHTCGLTPLGQAYCWGYNFSFQIGVGTAGNSICAQVQPCRPTPTAVSGSLAFVSISAGSSNTCGLTSANQAYCWGEGAFGALGNGSQIARLATPQPVSGFHAFSSISVGQQYACGVTTAGQGYCWGTGSVGRLGNGSNSNRLTPVAVADGLTFASIETGAVHTCGVTTSSQAYCWGSGQFGRLGNGLSANASTPQLVSGGLAFASISAGGPHTCGVTAGGQGYCWGANIGGSIGDGTLFGRSTPSPVVGGLTFAFIHASGADGGGFSGNTLLAFSCGVTVEGQTYCWGSGFGGRLGNGSTSNRLTPTPVAAFP